MSEGENVVWAIAGILIAISPIGYAVGWFFWASIFLYIAYVFIRDPIIRFARFISRSPGDFVIICKWVRWLCNGKKL